MTSLSKVNCKSPALSSALVYLDRAAKDGTLVRVLTACSLRAAPSTYDYMVGVMAAITDNNEVTEVDLLGFVWLIKEYEDSIDTTEGEDKIK